MDIVFFKPKEISGTAKVTIHKTGKFGFSKSASKLLELEKNRFCKIGKKSDGENVEVLFMVICKESDEYTYNISKAGDYYYIKAKQLLIDLDIDYTNTNKTIIYDIIKKEENNNVFFKLVQRILQKRKKPSS